MSQKKQGATTASTEEQVQPQDVQDVQETDVQDQPQDDQPQDVPVTQEQLQAFISQFQAVTQRMNERAATPTAETNEAVLKLWQSDAYKAEKSAAKRAHMTMKTRAANDEAYAAEIKAARKAAAEKAGATRKAAAIQQANMLNALQAQAQAMLNAMKGGQQ